MRNPPCRPMSGWIFFESRRVLEQKPAAIRRFHSNTALPSLTNVCRQRKTRTARVRVSGTTLACPAKSIIASANLSVNITKGTPCPESPDQSPYHAGRLWTRRDSNPHLLAGQANVLPLHHGPCASFTALCGGTQLQAPHNNRDKYDGRPAAPRSMPHFPV